MFSALKFGRRHLWFYQVAPRGSRLAVLSLMKGYQGWGLWGPLGVLCGWGLLICYRYFGNGLNCLWITTFVISIVELEESVGKWIDGGHLSTILCTVLSLHVHCTYMHTHTHNIHVYPPWMVLDTSPSYRCSAV